MIRYCLSLLACVSCLCVTVAGAEQDSQDRKPVVAKKPMTKAKLAELAARRAYYSLTAQVPKQVDPKNNVERFLVLLPGGPVVVDVALTIDGQPFRMLREKLVDELLKTADTDGDGKSTWAEAVTNPQFAFGRYAYQVRNKALRDTFAKRCDLDKDSLVSRYEARVLMSQLGGGPAFRTAMNPYAYNQPDLKKVLDTNNDGALSKEELAVAEQRLKSRDKNDNDLLEFGEAGGGYSAQFRYRNRGGVRTAPPSLVYLLGQTADLVAVDRELRRRYGKKDDQNVKVAKQKQKLRAESFPLFPKLVEQLDLNKNGELDSGEVIGFHLLKPHVVLEVSFGSADKAATGVAVKALVPELGNKEAVNAQMAKQQTLTLSNVKLRFSVLPTVARQRASYERYAKSTISRYDTNKNGYLEKKELEKDQNTQQLLPQFAVWDANKDGKVFADEITAWYLRQRAPLMSQVSMLAAKQGPALFSMLDESGDNRLSLREMRMAGKRLLSLDKNRDGQIGVAELPEEIWFDFGRGGARYNPRQTSSRRPGSTRTPARPAGPKWFDHMDRNGDGDLTLREFLGGEDKFKKLDTNADGFIERKEAKAASIPSEASTATKQRDPK